MDSVSSSTNEMKNDSIFSLTLASKTNSNGNVSFLDVVLPRLANQNQNLFSSQLDARLYVSKMKNKESIRIRVSLPHFDAHQA